MLKLQVIGLPNVQNALGKELESAVKRLSNDLFAEVRATTPVDTGRARSGWREKTTKKNFVIENKVPYIDVLDKGRHMTSRGMRGSKQAPNGIVGPSLKAIKGRN